MNDAPKIRIIVEGSVHTGKSMTAQLIKQTLQMAYPEAKIIHEDQDGEIAGAAAFKRLEDNELRIAATTFEIIEQTAVVPAKLAHLRDVSIPKAGPYRADG